MTEARLSAEKDKRNCLMNNKALKIIAVIVLIACAVFIAQYSGFFKTHTAVFGPNSTVSDEIVHFSLIYNEVHGNWENYESSQFTFSNLDLLKNERNYSMLLSVSHGKTENKKGDFFIKYTQYYGKEERDKLFNLVRNTSFMNSSCSGPNATNMEYLFKLKDGEKVAFYTDPNCETPDSIRVLNKHVYENYYNETWEEYVPELYNYLKTHS